MTKKKVNVKLSTNKTQNTASLGKSADTENIQQNSGIIRIKIKK